MFAFKRATSTFPLRKSSDYKEYSTIRYRNETRYFKGCFVRTFSVLPRLPPPRHPPVQASRWNLESFASTRPLAAARIVRGDMLHAPIVHMWAPRGRLMSTCAWKMCAGYPSF